MEDDRLVPRPDDNPNSALEEIKSAGAPDPRMSLTVESRVLKKPEPGAPGIKYDEGKLEYHLIPAECTIELVKVLMFGKNKYTEDNWKQHLSMLRIHDAVIRHMEAVRRGELDDPETGLSHYAHAMCGTMFLLWYSIQDKRNAEIRATKSP